MAYCNGVDVSRYQSTINIKNISADFVIVKATEGTSGVNPYWRRQADQTLESGKVLGLYHYANGGDILQEFNHFWQTVHDYQGRAFFVLDWETINNPHVQQFRAWTDIFMRSLSGASHSTPVIYTSYTNMQYFRDCGFPLWIAQYKTCDEHKGFLEHPAGEDVYNCLIRQYSQNGRINGYTGDIDLNKLYGDINSLKKLYLTDGDLDMTTAAEVAQAVWNYGTEAYGFKGGALSWLGSGAKASMNVNDNYMSRRDDGGTGDGSNGDPITRIDWIDHRVRTMADQMNGVQSDLQTIKNALATIAQSLNK